MLQEGGGDGSVIDWKDRAIEQWTADPCGPEAEGIFSLMQARRAYAPWMAERFDYPAAAGQDVLDAGCGQGIDVCEFGLAGARITGIDLTPRHVDLARAHAAEAGIEATILRGDIEKLPLADDSFDRVISNGVLHHTPNIDAALGEIRRVLRPGGGATVVVYNRNSFYFWLTCVLWRGVKDGLVVRERGMGGVLSATVEKSSIDARPLVRVYTSRQVRKLLERAGFGEISTWTSPYRKEDSPFTRRLPIRLPVQAGWYVVAHAR